MMTSEWFGFDKAKVIQALRHHFISRKEIRYMIILVNLFALISAALYYWKKVSPLAFLLASALWVVLMIVFWFILPYVIFRKTKMFKNRFRARLDDAGLELGTEAGTNQWTWDRFSSWSESPYFFNFYFSERSFFILPKDVFSPEDLELIRNYCRQKIRGGS